MACRLRRPEYGDERQMHATLPLLENGDFPSLKRRHVETLQVNLGYRCNQSCLHCHVNAGPGRKEEMDADTVDLLLDYLPHAGVRKLDLTGGAPELNRHFRRLVASARRLGLEVIDRCNLTILLEAGQEDLATFLADHQVQIVASLPCYEDQNVDEQRGKGVYAASIRALKDLNELGYGRSGGDLQLNLMYNPAGPSLPPAQQQLEADYRRELERRHGVTFSQLYVLANMPIKRFGSTLVSKGCFNEYMALLKGAFEPENLENVMCRTLLSLDWEGYLYDCDFNQMLGLSIRSAGKRLHLRDLFETDLAGRSITVRDHCYGCTAGQGSSCGGAL